jgi:hypothetical protein
MEKRQRLDRTKIEEAFRIMGQYLLDRKTLGEIAIYGGSAILFQLDWRRPFRCGCARDQRGQSRIIMEEVPETLNAFTFLSHGSMRASRCMRAEMKLGRLRFSRPLSVSGTIWSTRDGSKAWIYIGYEVKALERATADDRDYQRSIGVRTIEDSS